MKPVQLGTNNYGAEKHLNATKMSYDELNRQTAYQGQEGEEHTQYRGPEWHRWQTATSNGLTRYFHDALTDNMISDQESTLGGYSRIARIYFAPFLDQPLADYAVTTAATTWYSLDYLGSVRTLTDTNGIQSGTKDYLAFGERRGANTNSIPLRHGFAGREDYAVAPMMYYRTRPYNPDSGRMFNRSPWGHIQQRMSLYDAMQQNPANKVEPYSTAGDPFSPPLPGAPIIPPQLPPSPPIPPPPAPIAPNPLLGLCPDDCIKNADGTICTKVGCIEEANALWNELNKRREEIRQSQYTYLFEGGAMVG